MGNRTVEWGGRRHPCRRACSSTTPTVSAQPRLQRLDGRNAGEVAGLARGVQAVPSVAELRQAGRRAGREVVGTTRPGAARSPGRSSTSRPWTVACSALPPAASPTATSTLQGEGSSALRTSWLAAAQTAAASLDGARAEAGNLANELQSRWMLRSSAMLRMQVWCAHCSSLGSTQAGRRQPSGCCHQPAEVPSARHSRRASMFAFPSSARLCPHGAHLILHHTGLQTPAGPWSASRWRSSRWRGWRTCPGRGRQLRMEG